MIRSEIGHNAETGSVEARPGNADQSAAVVTRQQFRPCPISEAVYEG